MDNDNEDKTASEIDTGMTDVKLKGDLKSAYELVQKAYSCQNCIHAGDSHIDSNNRHFTRSSDDDIYNDNNPQAQDDAHKTDMYVSLKCGHFFCKFCWKNRNVITKDSDGLEPISNKRTKIGESCYESRINSGRRLMGEDTIMESSEEPESIRLNDDGITYFCPVCNVQIESTPCLNLFSKDSTSSSSTSESSYEMPSLQFVRSACHFFDFHLNHQKDIWAKIQNLSLSTDSQPTNNEEADNQKEEDSEEKNDESLTKNKYCSQAKRKKKEAFTVNTSCDNHQDDLENREEERETDISFPNTSISPRNHIGGRVAYKKKKKKKTYGKRNNTVRDESVFDFLSQDPLGGDTSINQVTIGNKRKKNEKEKMIEEEFLVSSLDQAQDFLTPQDTTDDDDQKILNSEERYKPDVDDVQSSSKAHGSMEMETNNPIVSKTELKEDKTNQDDRQLTESSTPFQDSPTLQYEAENRNNDEIMNTADPQQKLKENSSNDQTIEYANIVENKPQKYEIESRTVSDSKCDEPSNANPVEEKKLPSISESIQSQSIILSTKAVENVPAESISNCAQETQKPKYTSESTQSRSNTSTKTVENTPEESIFSKEKEKEKETIPSARSELDTSDSRENKIQENIPHSSQTISDEENKMNDDSDNDYDDDEMSTEFTNTMTNRHNSMELHLRYLEGEEDTQTLELKTFLLSAKKRKREEQKEKEQTKQKIKKSDDSTTKIMSTLPPSDDEKDKTGVTTKDLSHQEGDNNDDLPPRMSLQAEKSEGSDGELGNKPPPSNEMNENTPDEFTNDGNIREEIRDPERENKDDGSTVSTELYSEEVEGTCPPLPASVDMFSTDTSLNNNTFVDDAWKNRRKSHIPSKRNNTSSQLSCLGEKEPEEEQKSNNKVKFISQTQKRANNSKITTSNNTGSQQSYSSENIEYQSDPTKSIPESDQNVSGINDLKEKTEDGGREDYDSCESDEETIVVPETQYPPKISTLPASLLNGDENEATLNSNLVNLDHSKEESEVVNDSNLDHEDPKMKKESQTTIPTSLPVNNHDKEHLNVNKSSDGIDSPDFEEQKSEEIYGESNDDKDNLIVTRSSNHEEQLDKDIDEESQTIVADESNCDELSEYGVSSEISTVPVRVFVQFGNNDDAHDDEVDSDSSSSSSSQIELLSIADQLQRRGFASFYDHFGHYSFSSVGIGLLMEKMSIYQNMIPFVFLTSSIEKPTPQSLEIEKSQKQPSVNVCIRSFEYLLALALGLEIMNISEWLHYHHKRWIEKESLSSLPNFIWSDQDYYNNFQEKAGLSEKKTKKKREKSQLDEIDNYDNDDCSVCLKSHLFIQECHQKLSSEMEAGTKGNSMLPFHGFEFLFFSSLLKNDTTIKVKTEQKEETQDQEEQKFELTGEQAELLALSWGGDTIRIGSEGVDDESIITRKKTKIFLVPDATTYIDLAKAIDEVTEKDSDDSDDSDTDFDDSLSRNSTNDRKKTANSETSDEEIDKKKKLFRLPSGTHITRYSKKFVKKQMKKRKISDASSLLIMNGSYVDIKTGVKAFQSDQKPSLTRNREEYDEQSQIFVLYYSYIADCIASCSLVPCHDYCLAIACLPSD